MFWGSLCFLVVFIYFSLSYFCYLRTWKFKYLLTFPRFLEVREPEAEDKCAYIGASGFELVPMVWAQEINWGSCAVFLTFTGESFCLHFFTENSKYIGKFDFTVKANKANILVQQFTFFLHLAMHIAFHGSIPLPVYLFLRQNLCQPGWPPSHNPLALNFQVQEL